VVPHLVHCAEPAVLAAKIRTRVGEVSTASMTSPDRCGTNNVSPATAVEKTHYEANDDHTRRVVTESEPEPVFRRR